MDSNRAAAAWEQHRDDAEVLEVRPTRMAGREELREVAQVTSLSYEVVLRARGVDGVMTRPFYTAEEETLFRSVLFVQKNSPWMEYRGKLYGWQTARVVWLQHA